MKKFVQFHFFLVKRLSHKTKNTQTVLRQYIIDIYSYDKLGTIIQ